MKTNMGTMGEVLLTALDGGMGRDMQRVRNAFNLLRPGSQTMVRTWAHEGRLRTWNCPAFLADAINRIRFPNG